MKFTKIIGWGAILIIPVLIKRFRPIGKEAFKGGVKVGERVKEMAAVAGEEFEDMIAEARMEMKKRA